MLIVNLRLTVASALLCLAGWCSAATELDPSEFAPSSRDHDADPLAGSPLSPQLTLADGDLRSQDPVYLDAVRAQREALRLQQDQPSGMDGLDQPLPWAANAEQEWRSRREEVRDRIDRQREEMDAYRRWSNPRAETFRELQKQRREQFQARRQAEYERLEQRRRHHEDGSWRDAAPPFGWDNPWYYRGF